MWALKHNPCLNELLSVGSDDSVALWSALPAERLLAQEQLDQEKELLRAFTFKSQMGEPQCYDTPTSAAWVGAHQFVVSYVSPFLVVFDKESGKVANSIALSYD